MRTATLVRSARNARAFSSSARRLIPAPDLPPSPVSPTASPTSHLLTLADLDVARIQTLITSALAFKRHFKEEARIPGAAPPTTELPQGLRSLDRKTVALIFNKRSTRTRVASESAVQLLGGHPMFLGAADIQLGVNETLEDTSKVVSSMVDGIMARVGPHADIEEFAKHSSVPVINALSDKYHPTQILADLQTLLELHGPFSPYLSSLSGLTVAWVGDSNNILNEMLVTYPRIGINLQIATPKGYELDGEVLSRAKEGIEREAATGLILHSNSPEEAVKGADVIVTDTWISMGQEEESKRRLRDFAGFQVTEDLLKRGGAKPSALFMHCLPRHEYEVDDAIFYGPRSIVFPEAENRKWTILSTFNAFLGH